MRAAVITFPGSNCDRDAFTALEKFGVKVSKIWHQETSLANGLDLIIVPGGFSYGDYLRSGAMASISPIMQEVKKFSDKGGKVLGICNGFQILTETEMLPGVLMRNEKMKFICRQIHLRVENNSSAFTSKYEKNQVIKVPIAHMDGNYFATAEELKKIQDNQMIAFRYSDEAGNISDESNPNGSLLGIAGVFNEKKNVLGMMPHPERAIENILGSDAGSPLFLSIFGL